MKDTYKILEVKQSDYNNIYIVGDIHGMFHLLEEELIRINFNKKTDLLIAVGDLIDRGKNSIKATEYLKENWFVSVFGNHDFKFMNVPDYRFHNLYPPKEYFDKTLSFEKEKEFRKVFNEELYAGIEIILEDRQKIAIVHAEIPIGFRWEDFKKYLKQGNYEAIKASICNRGFAKLCQLKLMNENNELTTKFYKGFIKRNKMYNNFRRFNKYKPNFLKNISKILKYYEDDAKISDLKASFHGHSITNKKGKISNFSNRYYLETGAFLTESFISNIKDKTHYIPEEDNNYKFSLFNIKNL
jgi:serine/threonine protein phosphatase 1